MKKGFTLIELLAVIVILAIIALIATPIIISIIDDIKKSSSLRSAEFYLDAVEISLTDATLNNKKIKNGTYDVLKNGNVCLEYDSNEKCIDELEVEVKGETPRKGIITIVDREIEFVDLRYEKTTIVKNETGQLKYYNSFCVHQDSEDDTGKNINKIDLSDIITCGEENFYVMKNDGRYVTMLSMYNLNVGDNKYPNEETYGIQDEHVFGTKDGYDSYGTIKFSLTSYWTFEDYDVIEPWKYKNIYDNNSLLYSHVMAYETYLKEIGVNSATSSLLTFEQYIDLRNNLGNPEWIYNSSYWFASVAGEDYVWCIPNDGVFRGGYYMNDDNGGIRPVVTISINEIK